jgi:kynurenine formamidase
MPRLVEISGQIANRMWDYNVLDLNGAVLPSVRVEQVASIGQHGFDAHAIQFSTLTATYLETAAHMIEGRPTIDQIPLQEFIKPAKLMRLPNGGPRTLIRLDDLRRHAPHVEPGDALLIDTGWGAHWNQPDYISHAPAFARATLDWFLEQPFSILGLDTPVMECRWGQETGVASEAGPLLVPLYQREMLLLAPLVNLDQITQPEGTLIAFPLNIVGVCSTPCRAVFMEGVRL